MWDAKVERNVAVRPNATINSVPKLVRRSANRVNKVGRRQSTEGGHNLKRWLLLKIDLFEELFSVMSC